MSDKFKGKYEFIQRGTVQILKTKNGMIQDIIPYNRKFFENIFPVDILSFVRNFYNFAKQFVKYVYANLTFDQNEN